MKNKNSKLQSFRRRKRGREEGRAEGSLGREEQEERGAGGGRREEESEKSTDLQRLRGRRKEKNQAR